MDTGVEGEDALCALALAMLVLLLSFLSRGTARPYAEKPQMQWQHSLSSPFLQRTNCLADTRRLSTESRSLVYPTAHSKCSSPDCQSLRLCFPSFVRIFICSLRNIPVLPKRFSASLLCGDSLPFYKK